MMIVWTIGGLLKAVLWGMIFLIALMVCIVIVSERICNRVRNTLRRWCGK